MPFTRNDLDYPICRLFFRVGLHLNTWVRLYPIPRKQRPEFNKKLGEYLGLEQAIKDELILKYVVRYDRQGFVDFIRIVPHPKVRRTPGIAKLKKLFFSHYYGSDTKRSQKP